MYELLRKYILKNGLKYFIETYGCQMNVHESEKIAGVLEGLGYKKAVDKQKADIIIFNTCCIRQHAEARLRGNVGALKKHKTEVPESVIAVGGCMMQQHGVAEKLQKRFPFVDIVFGTNDVHRLESLINDAIFEGKCAACIENDESVIEDLPVKRSGEGNAYVNIIYGCNNYCSYCVVPYVRGRERSRRYEDILKEIRELNGQGITEVTLLGQNVNSYGKNLESGGLSFPQLLEMIDGETEIKRIRFMTSHPKDMTDDLIGCFGRLGSLCEHIHLPVQSGSDKILKDMNRKYTGGHYMELVRKLRERVPDIAITTDIIVGFPGETESDFNQTMELVRKVRFDAAYTFAYSSRPMTKAASMPEHIDKQEKAQRLKMLNALIKECMFEKNRAYLGKDVEVLVEGISPRDKEEVYGRTRTGKTVVFRGKADEAGKYLKIKIDEVKAHTLHGIRREKG